MPFELLESFWWDSFIDYRGHDSGLEDEAPDFSVCLCSNPHLWALGSDQIEPKWVSSTRVSGFILRYGGKSLDIQRMSLWKGVSWGTVALERLPFEVFRAHPTGRRPWGRDGMCCWGEGLSDLLNPLPIRPDLREMKEKGWMDDGYDFDEYCTSFSEYAVFL